MADLGFGDSGFDATAPENQSDRSVVPAGTYTAIIAASEKVATKDGKGQYLKLQWQIVRGEFINRVIFQNVNLWLAPEKDQAIKIARGQMSEICRACGVLTPKDSSELHGKACDIKVKVRKSDQYSDQNEISGVKAAGAPTSRPAESEKTVAPWG